MLCNSYLLTTCKKLCKSEQIICKNVPYNLGNRYIHAVIRTCVGNVFNKTSILLSHMLPARIYIVKKQPQFKLKIVSIIKIIKYLQYMNTQPQWLTLTIITYSNKVLCLSHYSVYHSTHNFTNVMSGGYVLGLFLSCLINKLQLDFILIH